MSAGKLDQLRERSRQMRNEPTGPEKRLWVHLSSSHFGGCKFRRQAIRHFAQLCALSLVTACSPVSTEANSSNHVLEAPEPTIVQAPREDDPVVMKGLAALSSEPKIKDVMYQPDAAVKWSVGVFDDGSSRNGYAQYICLTLKDVGLDVENIVVRVVDIVKIAQGGVPGSSSSLGSAICKNGEPFD